jgi:hypothetical protein
MLGILIAGFAFIMDTTVYSPPLPSIGGYGGTDGGRTFNLGLLQRQELVFIGGCALFVGGCLLAGIGQLHETLINRTFRDGPRSHAPEVGETSATVQAAPAGEWAASTYTVEDDTDYKRLFIVIGGIMLALLALFLAIGPGKSPEAAAIEANADMLADNLEAQADNLEELADNAAQYR